ncbi:MFS transporter [hot springs metagenome]|uniref:MFS transporter n=1 Tax=hot springs metagenome TaxID=433727 RepID=A0A5J4L5K9_9ZZZZ
MNKLAPYLQVFTSRRIATVTLLGFASGLPLALTSGTLQAWMAVDGVDIKTIGVFALVGLPYTIKFLWSPIMDRFVPPFLGRRRGWIIIAQIALISGIAAMAFNSPKQAPLLMAVLALTVAFSSASQDIVIDAYRTDILREKERGAGAAVFVMGYRIAMLISGALSLILSDNIGWHNTYLLMAGLMTISLIATFLGPEPEEKIIPPKSLHEAIWGPLKDYFSRRSAVMLLLLIILYKLGDAYAGSLTTAFLIKGVGFTPTDVGTINKGLGLISLIVGAMFGGALMTRLGLFKSLLFFGALQAVSNLSFMVLAWIGKSYWMLIFAVAFENLSGGMGTSAFVALLMSICNQKYSATQYALLSSLAALGRIFIAPTSGFLVSAIGWSLFFFVTTLVALPGLWLLWCMRQSIENLKQY